MREAPEGVNGTDRLACRLVRGLVRRSLGVGGSLLGLRSLGEVGGVGGSLGVGGIEGGSLPGHRSLWKGGGVVGGEDWRAFSGS